MLMSAISAIFMGFMIGLMTGYGSNFSLGFAAALFSGSLFFLLTCIIGKLDAIEESNKGVVTET